MSMNQPWLSIVIPAYNVQRYLESCIKSIEPEEHKDIQIILVDDGSTDSTPEICDGIASLYSNVAVVHKKNGGLPSARNEGFSHAAGTWIWFVDSDDLIAPGALGLLERVAAFSIADAIEVGVIPFADGKKPAWPMLSVAEKSEIHNACQFISEIHSGIYPHYIPSFLFRMSSLRGQAHDNAGPFREDFSLYEDVVAIEALLRKFAYIETIKRNLYGYRQSSSSMTHKLSSAAAESGLRAVRVISHFQSPLSDRIAKTRMEISLLFSAYKLVEEGADSPLSSSIRSEIEQRVNSVGIIHLGCPRFIRYLLLKSGVLDRIIHFRSKKQ